jgi:hypothetical protein
LRATTFFAVRAFVTTAFFLTAAFFVTLDFAATFGFTVLRAATVCLTARFAFGRAAALEGVARLLAVDLEVERRETVRDVVRLKPLVTALIRR